MKTNQGLIVLSDRTADHSRLRSVLDDWGYSEKEIQRFLSEMSTPAQESLGAINEGYQEVNY
jgi:hypothetical protein